VAAERLARLREALAVRDDVDVLIVTAQANVRYLSGFTGSNGTLVVGAETAALLTDFRYVEQAGEQSPDYEIVDGGREPRARLLELAGAGAIGFDERDMRVAQFRGLEENLPEGATLVAAAGVVEQLRAVKDAGEIEKIAAAALIADSIYVTLAEEGLVGRTESEVAWRIEQLARDGGASGLSFDSIVASGAHGALPHAEPRDVKIEQGQLVTLDLGVVHEGYCSDCTRTFATGELPDEQRDAYELVLKAQETALAGAVAGAECSAVDALARDLIAEAGMGELFGHSLGHGVGIEVHERPTLSTRSEDTLVLGNVVTVEPGVYLPGGYGIRIEDLVVVEDGAPRVLTPFTKQLIDVG
jgi:Xaa-Pro aminopeptidase